MVGTTKEQSKLLVQCAYKCVVCKVYANKIINASGRKDPTIKDLVVLCTDCNSLFGGNPKKWKKIKLMRDWLIDLVGIQDETVSFANSNGIKYSIASVELRNYLINSQITLPMYPNKFDSLDAFKYVLNQDVTTLINKYDVEYDIALIVDLHDDGMKRRQKRDYWQYLKKGIIDDYLHIFDEMHLPHCSIVKHRNLVF